MGHDHRRSVAHLINNFFSLPNMDRLHLQIGPQWVMSVTMPTNSRTRPRLMNLHCSGVKPNRGVGSFAENLNLFFEVLS